MADYERRNNGHRGGRKRRYRGTPIALRFPLCIEGIGERDEELIAILFMQFR
jgi:hypothetical protein